jgi:hypothetical protein
MKIQRVLVIFVCFFSTLIMIAGKYDDNVVTLCQRQRLNETCFFLKNSCLWQCTRPLEGKNGRDEHQVMGSVLPFSHWPEVTRFDVRGSQVIGLIKQWVNERNKALSGLWFEIKDMSANISERIHLENFLITGSKMSSEVTEVGPFTISADGTEIVSLEKHPSDGCVKFVTRKKTSNGWVAEMKDFPDLKGELQTYKALGYLPSFGIIHLFHVNDAAPVSIFKIPE